MQLIFTKLFKPKWQHTNPAVRRTAIDKLEPGNNEHQVILATLAQRDADTDVRCAAIERLNEPTALQELLVADSQPQVRQAALHRCCQLLTAPTAENWTQAQYQTLLTALKEPEPLTHLVVHATDPELCASALRLISDSRYLEQIATSAATATLRQIAAERISDPSVLESLQRSSKSKDKGVFRIVRGKLKLLREQEAEQQRLRQEAEETCDSLQHLARTALYPLYAAKLEALIQQWEHLSATARQHCEAEFEQALGACRDKLEAQKKAEAEEQAQRQKEQACRSERATWLDTQEALLQDWQPLAAEAAPPVSAEALQQQWQALAGELPFSPSETKRFESLHQAATQHHVLSDKLAQQREAIDALNQTPADGDDPRAHAQQLKALFKALNWPKQVALPPLLQALQDRLEGLNEAQNESQQAQRQEAKEISRQLSTLEKHLDNGEARAALQLHRQLAAQVNADECTPALAQRFKALHARIQELKSWQQFAVVPKKEELCERMEQLIDATIDAPQRAERVKALQQEWKVLDSQDSEHSQALWSRFKQASDGAYAPCKEYYAEQQRQRQSNLEKRELLCEQLQAYIDENFATGEQSGDNTNSALDWKLVEQLIRTAKQEWRSYSPVDRKPGQAVQDRFNKQLRRLEAELNAEYERNAGSKQELVEQAEALLDQDNLKAATEAAKGLQAQWKQIGAADRKQERDLWKRFRKACNALFEQRHAEWEQKKAADLAARSEALEICESVEALAPEADQFKRQLADLKQRFGDLDLSGRDARKLQHRFEDAIARLEAKSQDPLLSEQEQATWLERKALCQQAEALALEEADTPSVESLRDAWASAGKLPAPYASLFETRFQDAPKLHGENADAYIEAAEKQLRLICIRLEISANAASPDADQALRMEYQMNRLKEALKPSCNTQSSIQRQLEELELEWGCSLLENRFPELEQRFNALRDQLK